MMMRRLQAPTVGRPQLTRGPVLVQAAKGFGTPRKAPPKQQKDQTQPEQCACGSGKAYKNCCEQYHSGAALTPTPEATLRARFSAYHKGQLEYIVKTTHPDYHVYHYNVPTPGGAEQRLREDIASACNKFAFTGLRIVANEPGGSEHEGYVSFEYLSRKKMGEDGQLLGAADLEDTSKWDRTAEKCRFIKPTDQWQFVDYQRATFAADMMSGMQSEVAAAAGSQ